MVLAEVRNSTHESAAYETTTSAHLPREESSAGFFNAQDRLVHTTSDEFDRITQKYDTVDASLNYSEEPEKFWFKKKKAQQEYKKSWENIIRTEGTYDNAGLDTGEIEAIQETAEKINSGELYASEQIVDELGKRALALVPLADVELPAAQVENALLRVVVVNPDFEEKADKAIDTIYSNRPGVSPAFKKIIRDTVHNTARVASQPDDFIETNSVDGNVLAVDRILEQASHMATSRRITQAVQEKEWAEEDDEMIAV